MSFTLPLLTYDYNDLEPYIDAETMKIHHTKHHQTYINNTNIALQKMSEFSNLTIYELIQKLDLLPENLRMTVRNNAGGHINHDLFWKLLKKNTVLQGTLKDSIENNFGTVENFKNFFEKAAIDRFGSGWVWLIKKGDKLNIVSTANQDNPLMEKENSCNYGYPILGLDVWEHAYYLKHKNLRLNYVNAFWYVVNWDEVSNRFNKCV